MTGENAGIFTYICLQFHSAWLNKVKSSPDWNKEIWECHFIYCIAIIPQWIVLVMTVGLALMEPKKNVVPFPFILFLGGGCTSKYHTIVLYQYTQVWYLNVFLAKTKNRLEIE